jgi:hypothetical protein
VSSIKYITTNEWLDKYKPIANHLDSNASWQTDAGNDGIMFETYGEEYAFVESHYGKGDRVVWSYMDDEYEGLIITSGLAQSTAIGYFITEVPWEVTDNIIVQVEENYND